MIATLRNAIFLQATMESISFPTRLQTAFWMSEIADPCIRRRAVRHLEKGRVVIFAAGMGNPFFTTDTQILLLPCVSVNAGVVLMTTNVNGIYEECSSQNPNATFVDTLSYSDVISRDLSVMDMTAITFVSRKQHPSCCLLSK